MPPAPAYTRPAVPTPLPPEGGIFSEDSPFFGGSPAGEPTIPLPIDVFGAETQTGS